jgi:hypothetical protein
VCACVCVCVCVCVYVCVCLQPRLIVSSTISRKDAWQQYSRQHTNKADRACSYRCTVYAHSKCIDIREGQRERKQWGCSRTACCRHDGECHGNRRDVDPREPPQRGAEADLANVLQVGHVPVKLGVDGSVLAERLRASECSVTNLD